MCFRMVVLPALGGETISPRCPRPIGATRLIRRGRKRVVIDLEVEAFVRKDRREILEDRPARGLLGIKAVDALHFEQSIVALRFTGRANVSNDQVSRAKFVAAQLRLRDVDVLIADAIVGRSQETDALAHDLEDAAAQFDALLLRLRLPDLKDEGLFLQAVEIGDVEILGNGAQFGQRFVLELQDFHVVDAFWDDGVKASAPVGAGGS